MHPLQRGHFLFQSLSILHGDLCASHYPPKTQGRQSLKLCPTLKEGSEVWGDHKQIWMLPFPEALLIAEWLPGDLGRSKAVVPAPSSHCLHPEEQNGQADLSSWGGDTDPTDPFRQ